MIPSQSLFAKSRLNRPYDQPEISSHLYSSKAVDRDLTRSIRRMPTFTESCEDNWKKQNCNESNHNLNYGFRDRENNELLQNYQKSDLTNSTLKKYPKYEVRDKSKPFNQGVNKSKAKICAKSSKNIPLYERLKNVDYTEKKKQEQSEKFMSTTYEPYSRKDLAKSMRKTTNYEEHYVKPKREQYKTNTYIEPSYRKKEQYHQKKFTQEDDLRVTPCFNYSNNKSERMIKIDMVKDPKLDDFALGQCKGQGRFGKVYLAIHKKTGMIFALKKIRKEAVRFMIDQFITELKIQQYLSHPNLVKIYGYFTDKDNFYMLVEYMQEGSLYSLMKKQGKKLSESETAMKMRQVCQGIKFMHEQNIVHRDMKPQNIVLTNGVCKVCDFGWAAICQDRRSTYCGTLDYVCPEIADGKQYDSSVDIWCLGVMAYQMMCGKAPFYDISRTKTIQNIKSCKIDSYPSHLSRQAVMFIRMILQKDPQSRVSIKQLLCSQFLRNTQL